MFLIFECTESVKHIFHCYYFTATQSVIMCLVLQSGFFNLPVRFISLLLCPVMSNQVISLLFHCFKCSEALNLVNVGCSLHFFTG